MPYIMHHPLVNIFKKFTSIAGDAPTGSIGPIGLGGGDTDTDTVGKYFGGCLAIFPSCFEMFGVKIAETGGGINISEKILSMS